MLQLSWDEKVIAGLKRRSIVMMWVNPHQSKHEAINYMAFYHLFQSSKGFFIMFCSAMWLFE